MGQPLTPSLLVYGLRSAGDPQVSPDGRRQVFTVSETTEGAGPPVSQIWLASIDGSDPLQLTRAPQSSFGARWSPDGSRLAFLSARNGGSTLYTLELSTPGEPREVTRHRTPINGLCWMPDGTSLVYATPVDPENPTDEAPSPGEPPKVRATRRIDYKQDDRGYLGDTRYQVFMVDAATGARRQLTVAVFDHFYPTPSPDGRWVAVQAPNRNEMHSQLHLVSLTGEDERIVGPYDGTVVTWAWSPESRRIVFSGDTTQTFHSDFFVYSLDDDSTRRVAADLRCLPDGGFRLLAPPSQPRWLADDTILFHAHEAGESGIYRLNLETGEVSRLMAAGGMNAGFSSDNAGRYIAQSHASLERTGEIAVFDRERGTMSVVTDYSGPLLRDSPPAKHEKFTVERDGLTIDAWLLFPPDFDPTHQYPVVMDVHGGPNGVYGPGFNAIQQLLATNGFLVVYSNPRGSTTYGREFTMHVARDWGGEDYADLMAVLDSVLARPYADSTRTGIWGYSYGGYMTAWCIGQSPRFQAAVCGAPCFDLASMYGTSDIGHSFGDIHWGGPPTTLPDWYRERSPSTYAHQVTTPTLIVHGEADERCPIGQGEQMFVALKRARVETEFVRYPGGSHLFLRNGPPSYKVDLYTRMLHWFRHYLLPGS